jgi:hypothetical protein
MPTSTLPLGGEGGGRHPSLGDESVALRATDVSRGPVRLLQITVERAMRFAWPIRHLGQPR